jgi:hypothetical protein
MRKVTFALLILFAAGCGRHAAQAQTNPQLLIVSTFLDSAGDAEVSALAARKGKLPQTRELGAATQRTLSEMRDDLAHIAQRRNIQLPKGFEEKKIALRDNLSILPNQVLDRAYALAMSQDLAALIQKLDGTNDSDLQTLAKKYRAAIDQEHRTADQLLKSLGGYPWPTAP